MGGQVQRQRTGCDRVHTPAFGFGRNADNVRHGVKEIVITFPVALDSDYALWGAFRNQYRPHFALP